MIRHRGSGQHAPPNNTQFARFGNELPVSIPTETPISFLVFGLLFFLKPNIEAEQAKSSRHDEDAYAISTMLILVFKYVSYVVVYLYALDFVSGISHGIFDNLPYLGALRELPHDLRNIRKYTKRHKISAHFWETLAYDHQRHHAQLWVQHSHVMNPGLHILLLWPITNFVLLATVYYHPCLMTLNNWIYWLIYALPTVYFIHSLAHARIHAPLLVPWWIRKLQDLRIILHPKVHRRHHQNTKRYYSIVNGWSHSLQNVLLDAVGH